MSMPDYSAIFNSTGYENNINDIKTTNYDTLTSRDYSNLTKDVANVTNTSRTKIDMDTKVQRSEPLKPSSDKGFTSADINPITPMRPLDLPKWDVPTIDMPKQYDPNVGNGSGSDGSGSGGSNDDESESKGKSGFNFKKIIYIFLFIIFCICVGILTYYLYNKNKNNKNFIELKQSLTKY
jgi:preprotein translocase subunit SecG